MNPIRLLRDLGNLTQAELAEAAGTSQPAIASYEAGRKSPTLRTLRRLAEAAGFDATIGFHTPMTREERRSLHLHRAIARRLERSPEEVLAKARETLSLMRSKHPKAGQLLQEWEVILNRPVSEMAPALTDPSPWNRELRQVTPFAGVLSAEERTEVYRSFREDESR
jgi:transcriptional regulator with XRE-family HTH domain